MSAVIIGIPTGTVTFGPAPANPFLMAGSEGAARAMATNGESDLEFWMARYQSADPEAPRMLIRALSPALLGFFRAQSATRQESEDLLQDTWLRIHRVRHTYRPGEPLLPWVYAIARRVRTDGYRKRRRIDSREKLTDELPDVAAGVATPTALPEFEAMVAGLPDTQREVITLLKVGGLSLEEVARATSSTVGAVKQKAHRAYERLRTLLDARKEGLAR